MFAANGRQHLMPFGSILADRRIVAPIAPSAAVLVAAIVALGFLAAPIAVLEDLAMDSGVAALFTAAAPPYGSTARIAIAFFAALAAGSVTWFGLFLMFGTRTMVFGRPEPVDGVPVLRRADAHPDAPPRRPVFANRDLGTPFLEVKAEPVPVAEARDLPADLDTPLAAYLAPSDPPLPAPDPAAFVVPAPEPAPRPVPEPQPQPPVLTPVSAPRFAPHERIETFGLAPVVPTDDEPSAPLPQATIHDLLERLERGVARRQPEPLAETVQPEKTLEETLDALRALARRVG